MSRSTICAASACVALLMLSVHCPIGATPQEIKVAPSQEVSDATVQQKASKSEIIKLPRTNLADVPAELTAPIGVSAQHRPLLDKLETRRLSIDIREAPLSDLADSIRDQVGFNILLDQSALEEEGITSDTPITAQLSDAPLGNGLSRILEPLNLTYVVTHGVILITSQLESANLLTFQIYPVADLVWMGEASGDKAIDFDPLIKLIQECIFPNSWSLVGGAGTIKQFTPGLSLAINQTQAAHEEIVKVLRSLRKARSVANQVERSVPQELRKFKTARAEIVADEREQEIQRIAHELTISLDFDRIALFNAIHFLSEYSKLPIDLDRPALEEEGITPDTPISIKVSGLQFDDALALMLNRYNLTWIVKHGVILITSQLDAGNQLTARCYTVGDLVALSTDAERWSIFHGQLQEIIESIIRPNSWMSVGGAGSLTYFPTSQCLVVSQTKPVHEEITALLGALRESIERLADLTRIAGMPTPETLTESQLRNAGVLGERVK